MNAGAHNSDISNILSKALILFEDGTIDWLTHGEMEFSYRTSVLQTKRPGIVLEAEFQLQIGERERIVSVMQKNKDYRREHSHGIIRAQEVCFGIQPILCRRFNRKGGLRGYQKVELKFLKCMGILLLILGSQRARCLIFNCISKTNNQG